MFAGCAAKLPLSCEVAKSKQHDEQSSNPSLLATKIHHHVTQAAWEHNTDTVLGFFSPTAINQAKSKELLPALRTFHDNIYKDDSS